MKHTPAPWKIQIDWETRHPIAIIDPTTEDHPQGALHPPKKAKGLDGVYNSAVFYRERAEAERLIARIKGES